MSPNGMSIPMFEILNEKDLGEVCEKLCFDR